MSNYLQDKFTAPDISGCFIKVVNEITLDENLLIYHKVSKC